MRAEQRRSYLAGDELKRAMRQSQERGDRASSAREARAFDQFRRLTNEDVVANDRRLARLGALPETVLYRHVGCERSPEQTLSVWSALARAKGTCPGCGDAIATASLEPVPECACDECWAGGREEAPAPC